MLDLQQRDREAAQSRAFALCAGSSVSCILAGAGGLAFGGTHRALDAGLLLQGISLAVIAWRLARKKQ
jgi:hypothetical protein